MVMAMKSSVCPDGVTRAYTVEDENAVVVVRGYRVEGKITEEDGVMRFRQLANHHGYYPP